MRLKLVNGMSPIGRKRMIEKLCSEDSCVFTDEAQCGLFATDICDVDFDSCSAFASDTCVIDGCEVGCYNKDFAK